MNFLPKDWGLYPKEYNREVHGPYNPTTYYGKRDTPFGEVKLGELGAWLGRRNKSPRAIIGAISRAYWRYRHTWMAPKKPGPAFLYQFMATLSLTFFILDYHDYKKERFYRYH